MKLLFANGLCGMTPYQGSIVGGLYVFVVSLMQLAFEGGHLQRATKFVAQAPLNWTANSTDNISLSYIRLPQVTFVLYYFLLSLHLCTLVLVIVMLVALFCHRTRAILASTIWLVVFDVAMVILVSLLQVEMSDVGLTLSPLEWYGIACRLLGDPFWLCFVVTHGLQERSRTGSRRQRGRTVMNAEDGHLRLKFTAFDSSV